MKPSNLTTFLIAGLCIFALSKLVLNPSGAETTTLHPNNVVLYATDWCGYCKKTRKFFKENNIAYVEFDIEKSAEGKAQYQSLNGRGVPLVIVKGKLIRGYNPGLMQSLLDS